MRKSRKIVLGIFTILFVGLILDLYLPLKKDFTKFDGEQTGHLDQLMWRSYYEKKPFKLFNQLAGLMRNQFHAPFVRSYKMAYHSAKAAFTFKNGTNRDEYNKALPDLKTYFKSLSDMSKSPFDYRKMAILELEWWIIRRERDKHLPDEWSDILMNTCEVMYHLPKERFKEYADKRVEAMLLRDDKGNNITEEDWKKIDEMCKVAFRSLEVAVK